MECWSVGSGLLPRSGLCCHMLKVGLASEARSRNEKFRTELLESCAKPVGPSAGRARLHPVCGRRIEAVS